MSGQARIRRVREVIARAAALLECPRLENAAELVNELADALAELERLGVQNMGPEARQLAAALKADLRLLVAMRNNAARFYEGAARIVAANPTAYTRSGTATPGASISLLG